MTASTRPSFYEPDWLSLRRHAIPEWVLNAKFGVYSHWGLATLKQLPGNEEKYLRELIPQFTAERFDPEEWGELFAASGARYAGHTVWHGHGFVHWNSAVTRWNSAAQGPRIDIGAELGRAVRARGMKFLAGFHFGYWYAFPHWSGDPEYTNPEYEGLYGPVHDTDLTDVAMWKNHIEKQSKRSPEFVRFWLRIMKEAVGRLRPDFVWFDCDLGGSLRAENIGLYRGGKLVGEDIYLGGIPDPAQREFLADWFNQAAGDGQEVEFAYKVHDVPPGVGIRDIENGLLHDLQYDYWMTDINMVNATRPGDNWFWRPDAECKSATYLIHLLADVVSKNGTMLLNAPAAADGSFPEPVRRVLLDIGAWLSVNGEAVHDTMPWVVYGEGPTELPEVGHYSDRTACVNFTPQDIRFTQKGDVLYAICLGWPGETLTIRSLGSRGRVWSDEIESVQMLGVEGDLRWEQRERALVVRMPPEPPCPHAVVLRIQRRRPCQRGRCCYDSTATLQ